MGATKMAVLTCNKVVFEDMDVQQYILVTVTIPKLDAAGIAIMLAGMMVDTVEKANHNCREFQQLGSRMGQQDQQCKMPIFFGSVWCAARYTPQTH